MQHDVDALAAWKRGSEVRAKVRRWLRRPFRVTRQSYDLPETLLTPFHTVAIAARFRAHQKLP